MSVAEQPLLCYAWYRLPLQKQLIDTHDLVEVRESEIVMHSESHAKP